jgi:hypothetical protein
MQENTSIATVAAILIIAVMGYYYVMTIVTMVLYQPGDWHYVIKKEAVEKAKKGTFLSQIWLPILISVAAGGVFIALGWKVAPWLMVVNMYLYPTAVLWMRKTKV